jgi:hypothetical protein
MAGPGNTLPPGGESHETTALSATDKPPESHAIQNGRGVRILATRHWVGEVEKGITATSPQGSEVPGRRLGFYSQR